MQSEEYLARFPQRVRETMCALRALVREAAPDAAERVVPGWNIIVYEHRGIFCYIGPHRDRTTLGFNSGRCLPDPKGLLSSLSGAKEARNLCLDHPAEIDAAAVKELVQAAFVHCLMKPERKKRRPSHP